MKSGRNVLEIVCSSFSFYQNVSVERSFLTILRMRGHSFLLPKISWNASWNAVNPLEPACPLTPCVHCICYSSQCWLFQTSGRHQSPSHLYMSTRCPACPVTSCLLGRWVWFGMRCRGSATYTCECWPSSQTAGPTLYFGRVSAVLCADVGPQHLALSVPHNHKVSVFIKTTSEENRKNPEILRQLEMLISTC